MMFAVDSMLGKLARWLRILGYDTLYDPAIALLELAAQAKAECRVLLTRRRNLPDGMPSIEMFVLNSDKFPDQLRSVIHRFNLDTESGLFTRCLECNVAVQSVMRAEVRGRIPDRSFEGFDEFFECPKCHSVYWGGAHRKNTLRRLRSILQEQS